MKGVCERRGKRQNTKNWNSPSSLLIHPELCMGIPLVFLVKRGITLSLTSQDWHLLPCVFFIFFYFVCLFFASIIPFCLPASPPSLSVANDIRTLINDSWCYLNSLQIIDAGEKNINMSPTRSSVQSPTSCVPFLLTCFLLGSPKLAK